MDLSKLTYSKNDSRLTPEPPVLQPIAKNEEDGLVHESSGVAPAYQKSEGVLSTSLIFALSGGAKRERVFIGKLLSNAYQHLSGLTLSPVYLSTSAAAAN